MPPLMTPVITGFQQGKLREVPKVGEASPGSSEKHNKSITLASSQAATSSPSQRHYYVASAAGLKHESECTMGAGLAAICCLKFNIAAYIFRPR
jgi:hypothetical protein